MSRLVTFKWDEELVDRVDQARGSTPRSVFVREAVEQAMSEAKEPIEGEQADPGFRTPGEGRSASPAQARYKTTGQAKQGIKPIPKQGQ
jgi:predicted transcriptional regulator